MTVRGMKPLLSGVLGLLAIASAASAVSLSVVPDKTTYFVGETITLSVVGDDSGATSYGVQGRLDYSGALVDNGTRTQLTLTGPYGKWVPGVLYEGDDGSNAFSLAFNQVTSPRQTANNLPSVLSTVTLIAVSAGVVNLNWHTLPDGWELDFFGLTNAPGTSFTVIYLGCDGCSGPPVPEPATAALLGLGLIALATTNRGGRSR